ncbi:signal transduction histidine kinase [Catenulispora sp. MAP5-51]|uniref:sensor histidine kinase n=1 Tax=Catenulispora sp. MAP5-51 TaxID=3156298 RepID=UPI0035150D64
MVHPQVTADWLPDVLVGAIATAVLVVISAHISAGPDDRSADAVQYVLLVAAGVSMASIRRRPHLAAGIATLVLCVEIARRYPDGPIWTVGWISLAGVSWRTSRRTALGWAGAMLAALTLAAVVVGSSGLVLPLIFLGWSAAAILCGDALRDRRERLRALRERARFLELTQEEVALRRVAEERLRIARDLHDSVAHGMATINVQAAAAAHVIERRPQAAAEALVAIRRASGEVLEELGAMLSVLRDESQQADRAPAPGVGQIARLAESVAASGLRVEVVAEGPAPDLSPAVGTAAYRVVQESLTNVIRHSQARRARVEVVAIGGAGLCVEISDAGPTAPARTTSSGTGVGIRGMRERVTSTGGVFHAGRTARGGFLVRASWDGEARS